MAESDHNPFQAPMQRQEQSDPEWDASIEVVERQMRADKFGSYLEQRNLTGEELEAGSRALEVFLQYSSIIKFPDMPSATKASLFLNALWSDR